MLKRRLRFHLFSLLAAAPVLAAIPGGSMMIAILGISFLIFIHEWGHFMACRLTGTRTETFSIGFGPRLFGWEKSRDGTRRFTVGRRRLDPADHAMDFRIAAVPLGGYVKMAGEIPGEGGASTGQPPAPDEFPAKSAWARTFIISAGVIMNFITAVIFYFAAIQSEKAYRAPMVGDVAPGGAAWAAGIEPGDRVIQINGNTTPTWIDLQMEIAFSNRDEASSVVVERAGERKTLQVRPVYDEERGVLAFGIASVVGLQVGEGDAALAIGPDEVVEVAGVRVRGGSRALATINAAVRGGIYPVPVVASDGRRLDLSARPASTGEEIEAPGPKVALAPYAPLTVTALRGRALDALTQGDRLVAAVAAGERIPLQTPDHWNALSFRDGLEALVVERGGSEITRPLRLTRRADVAAFLDDVALKPSVDTRVVPLPAGNLYDLGLKGLFRLEGAPALAAGVRAGERVARVGTVITRTWEEIQEQLAKAQAGSSVDLTLQDDTGAERHVAIAPQELVALGTLPVTPVEYREHWAPGGVGQALALGAARTLRETKNVFRTIGALFSGTISFNKNIAGPITLVRASKDFAEDSFLRLLWFLAYVSVMLAVLNILPIPVLDGGHLMFILIEKIKGRPLEDETIFRFQKVGFLLLLVLMFFAFKNDITRLF